MWMMNLWKKLQRFAVEVRRCGESGLWENICNQSVLPAPWALRRLAQGELLAKNPCWEQSLSAFIFSLP
ncbi:hypothetical protein Csa_021383 [Cucumis sativus]|uniref:Uncharacterized protein n=1 Tax=Cucumis sativus TaxID=3659 RepID=A0A0A0KFH4_CUCSA|nr:hypothetical protein Csa_021383 [Cucumis sativus]